MPSNASLYSVKKKRSTEHISIAVSALSWSFVSYPGLLLFVAALGCSDAHNTNGMTSSVPSTLKMSSIDDLKVVRLIGDNLIVPDSDYNKPAMLRSLRVQEFKPSENKIPPGVPEWRIIVYANGQEVCCLDLFGPYGELVYDHANNRYFSWDYWDEFSKELVASRSDFVATLPAGVRSESD